MQRNRFLGDLISTLLDRRILSRGDDDTRDIYELSHALLSTEGEVSGLKLASTVLDRYHNLNASEKLAFFQFLNDALEIDAPELSRLAEEYATAHSPEAYKSLLDAAEPKRQELLRRLNQPVGATANLVAMRVDLLQLLNEHPDLRRTNLDFIHLLRSWFNRGFLVLQQISWDTPARILDKIVAYEAVHQINDWDDLRRRLYPPDRRCFAFFHPSMPDEPLIFVEIALTKKILGSIDDLLADRSDPLQASEAQVAVFYSISNCQTGLTGISFGNLLIKQVVAELSLEFPQLKTFVTLSPLPELNRWLQEEVANPDTGHVAAAILDGTAEPNDIRIMTARYLLTAKNASGFPRDPVARFHLGNGAEVHNIHADADTSPNGMAQSSGAMVNYLYDLASTERNNEDFSSKSSVAASRAVGTLANTTPSTKSKEESS